MPSALVSILARLALCVLGDILPLLHLPAFLSAETMRKSKGVGDSLSADRKRCEGIGWRSPQLHRILWLTVRACQEEGGRRQCLK
jgi:hypothetical protein